MKVEHVKEARAPEALDKAEFAWSRAGTPEERPDAKTDQATSASDHSAAAPSRREVQTDNAASASDHSAAAPSRPEVQTDNAASASDHSAAAPSRPEVKTDQATSTQDGCIAGQSAGQKDETLQPTADQPTGDHRFLWDLDAPWWCKCPISLEIMKDPVTVDCEEEEGPWFER